MSHLEDIAVRLQVYLEGLKTKDYREFNKVVKLIERAVADELADGELSELSQKNMEALVRRVTKENKTLIGPYMDEFVDNLKELAVYSYEAEAGAIMAGSTAKGLSETVSAKAAWEYATQRPLSATGTMLEAWVSKLETTQVQAIESLIRRAYADSWTNSQIMQVLRGTRANRYTDGIVSKLQSSNATVIRTAMQHVNSTSRMAVWEDNPDVVKGYQWVSTLDRRTSAICRGLDGKKFEMGKGPLPPIHPNCRSTTVAVLDPAFDVFDRGATRSSEGGSVPQNWTYYEWLKNQPKDYQDSVLGPVRGTLMREGGLNAEQFARLQLSSVFEPLTLDEMRRRQPLAFERAGI
jgi:SPP1 gp7 family putative phage head morphogenesis protein